MTQHRGTRGRRRGVGGSARGQEGFTLVEAVIAMVVFVIGIVAIMNLFLMASWQGQIANSIGAATTIASERLDVLKSIPFQTLRCGAGPGGDLESDTGDFDTEESVRGVVNIRTRWTVEAHDFNGPPGVFITVRSEPTINNARGQLARVQFSTYRSCTVVEKCDCGAAPPPAGP